MDRPPTPEQHAQAQRRHQARPELTRGLETALIHGNPHTTEEMQTLLGTIN